MQATSASTQDFPLSVQAITHHSLGFNANAVLGIGSTGEVIVQATSGHMHRIAHDGNDYTDKYKKNLPWVASGCFKATDRDRIFLQNIPNADTVCYDQELQELCTFQQEGLLFDCIGDELFYIQSTPGKRDRIIAVYQIDEVPSLQKLQLKKKVTLQPPAHHCWGQRPSICRVMESYVVVESEAGSLDIFDANGMICVMELINQFIHSKKLAINKYKGRCEVSKNCMHKSSHFCQI